MSNADQCRITGLFITLLMLFVLATAAQAGELLVDAAWLSRHLDDDKLVLLHVGSEETFEKGHIPGAQRINVHADLSDPASHSDDSLVLEMPSAEWLDERLEKLGISNDSTVVIYFSDDQITHATRALFTLDWAGLGSQTRLLDGGIDAWKAAGNTLSTDSKANTRGSLELAIRPELLVNHDSVQNSAGQSGVALLDGRSRAFYDGVRKDNDRSGHIPGAGSTPWTELVDHDLRFRESESLRDTLSAAGVAPGDTVVAYCHIGQYATAVLLAARLLGHEVKLYDGAFQDWARRDLPVSTEPLQ